MEGSTVGERVGIVEGNNVGTSLGVPLGSKDGVALRVGYDVVGLSVKQTTSYTDQSPRVVRNDPFSKQFVLLFGIRHRSSGRKQKYDFPSDTVCKAHA